MWKEDVSDVKGVWKMCGAARKIDLNENCELTNAFFDKGKNWRIIKIFKFNENRKNFWSFEKNIKVNYHSFRAFMQF